LLLHSSAYFLIIFREKLYYNTLKLARFSILFYLYVFKAWIFQNNHNRWYNMPIMIDDFSPAKRPVATKTAKKHPSTKLKETAFKPPEVVAAEEALAPPLPIQKALPPKSTVRRKRGFDWRSLTRLHKLTKKEWLIVAGVLVVLTGSGVGAWYKFIRKTPPKAPVVDLTPKKVVEPPKPITEASRLTGVQISPDLNKLPITGVMIENSPDARPQSGLKDAGVVYEAVAEGGITRFLALYQEAQPDYIGPVRSARPYYLDWILPFDGALGHVGGSPDALAQIRSLGVRDLDQFANSGAYQRVSSRYAPHNVYTSRAKLLDIQNKKGFGSSTFTGFARKAEAPAATPTARTINMTISSFLYNTHYDYDAASNSYKRSEGGKPHVDERSGVQIMPKVVIALVMAKSLASDHKHTVYGTVGSGKMFVFQDGIVAQGTWQKSDRKTQFTFTDANGKAFAFNPGQTWIAIVGEAGSVTYAP
jgi:hypothetical protein